MTKFSNAQQTLQSEIRQFPELRHPYLKAISEARGGRTVVSFFMSFETRTPLMPEDADQIEEILCNAKIEKGITLLLDAPGGDGLTAERIIRICKSYSKGDFETIVPARAKSAATMVCLGSDRILMSATSELGPIDPQVLVDLNGKGAGQWVAAHYITKTYDALFTEAKELKDGHIEPFLQQLSNFNAVQISQLRAATALAENIAVGALEKGMLKGKSKDEIKNLIKPFTDPDKTMSHGRGIDAEQAKECGLNVEVVGLGTDLWSAIQGLYVRSKYVVDATPSDKLIDTLEASYSI
jgi:ClpP class serine protease